MARRQSDGHHQNILGFGGKESVDSRWITPERKKKERDQRTISPKEEEKKIIPPTFLSLLKGRDAVTGGLMSQGTGEGLN